MAGVCRDRREADTTGVRAGPERWRPAPAGVGHRRRWTKGGREIVYRAGEALYATSFAPATGEAGTPVLLFTQPEAGRLSTNRTVGYDVTPDGSRFVIVVRDDQLAVQPVVVVLNWPDELKGKFAR